MGINTEDPQGLLHVDAKSNTVINANDTLNVEDDAVVSPQGRIGLGTTEPQTRLDIRNATPGAIRIQDGTEGSGKALVSDAKGSAHWEPLIWYAELKGGSSMGASSGSAAQIWPPFTFTGSELFPAGTGSAAPAAGTIQVPYTGVYRITLVGIADTNRTTGDFRSAITLLAGATTIDISVVFMMKTLGAVDFGHIHMISLTAGDVLKLSPYTAGNTLEANVYTNVRLLVEYVKEQNT